ncbi:MAG: hypothetical protein J3Q66DRAFT_89656 [Benniella sp.]|nr:MAG: hypothetical protein J3Q66DRAFT_89656 [Benniella sp.]
MFRKGILWFIPGPALPWCSSQTWFSIQQCHRSTSLGSMWTTFFFFHWHCSWGPWWTRSNRTCHCRLLGRHFPEYLFQRLTLSNRYEKHSSIMEAYMAPFFPDPAFPDPSFGASNPDLV